MTSSFSPPDFRLPQNATSPKSSSDHCHICSTHSSSSAPPGEDVTPALPSLKFYGLASPLLQHWAWQDLRRSACSLLKAGCQPSFAIISSFFGKSVAPDGVLWIRICTLGEAANQLMEEGIFKLFRGIVRDSSHQSVPLRFRHFIV